MSSPRPIPISTPKPIDRVIDFGDSPSDKPGLFEVKSRSNSYQATFTANQLRSFIDSLEEKSSEESEKSNNVGTTEEQTWQDTITLDTEKSKQDSIAFSAQKSQLRILREEQFNKRFKKNIINEASSSGDIKIDREENELLLSEKPTEQQDWLSWAASGVVSGFKAVGNGAYKAVTNPVSTTKSAALVGLSVVLAAPSALNALVNPSGKNPSEIGPKWWAEMTTWLKALSVVNSASSLVINAMMNAYFAPLAWVKFKTSIPRTFDGAKEFFDNILSIAFGLGGALAAGAIAYNAFLWLPFGAYTAAGPAFISFAMTFASRYIGIKNIFKRIHNLFSDDIAAQKEFADALDHTNKKYLVELHERFEKILDKLFQHRDPSLPLTADEYEAISRKLVKEVSEMAEKYPDLLDDPCIAEKITKYCSMIFDFLFSVFLIGIPAHLTFMQKGYDAVETIAHFANTELNGINPWLKRLIGAIPGFASGMLYADQGSKFRIVLKELAQYCYENPRKIPLVLSALIANGFASSGPQNVAAGVISHPNNLTGIRTNTPMGTAFIILNAAGGNVVNNNASINLAFLSSHKDMVNVTERDVANYLHKTNDNPVSHDVAEKFKLFRNKAHKGPSRIEERNAKRSDMVFIAV